MSAGEASSGKLSGKLRAKVFSAGREPAARRAHWLFTLCFTFSYFFVIIMTIYKPRSEQKEHTEKQNKDESLLVSTDDEVCTLQGCLSRLQVSYLFHL